MIDSFSLSLSSFSFLLTRERGEKEASGALTVRQGLSVLLWHARIPARAQWLFLEAVRAEAMTSIGPNTWKWAQ